MPLPPNAEPNTAVAEGCGLTHTEVIKFSYKWTINNFSYRGERVGEVLKSPIFSTDANNSMKWRLEIFSKGANEKIKDHLSLFLRLVSCNKTEVRVQFQFSILNIQNEKKKLQSFIWHRFSEGGEWGYKECIAQNFLHNKANEFLPYDVLTLCCEMNIVANSFSVAGPNSLQGFKFSKCSHIDNVGQLFDSQRFSDFILSVNSREFFVHKCILASQSPVFAAMFENEMEEKRDNRAEIKDMDTEVMEEMLRFVYTGKTSLLALEKMGAALLAAADKYDLQGLKLMCEEALNANISVDAASNLLVLADLHSANQLKTQAINFIILHVTEVMATSGWKTMIIQHPSLAMEVLRVQSEQTLNLGHPVKSICLLKNVEFSEI